MLITKKRIKICMLIRYYAASTASTQVLRQRFIFSSATNLSNSRLDSIPSTAPAALEFPPAAVPLQTYLHRSCFYYTCLTSEGRRLS